jgi:hypothetical protein
MDILKLLRFRSPPRTDKTTGRWILAGLFVLGVLALAGCGGSNTTPTDVVDAYIEAVRAGDVDAALALFTDDAMVTGAVGKEEIRKIIEMDIANVAAGYDYVGYYNVVETAYGVELDLRWHDRDGDMEAHNIIDFENGKVARWTYGSPKPVE